jgi:hypothetical protein
MKLSRSKLKHKLPTGAYLHKGDRYCEVCLFKCELQRDENATYGYINYWECPKCHRHYPVIDDAENNQVDPERGLYVLETIRCTGCGNEWLGRLFLRSGDSYIAEGFRICNKCHSIGETLPRTCIACSGTGEKDDERCVMCGGTGEVTYSAAGGRR